MKEKQSYQRINVELQVFYGPDQETVLTGFSADFSAGGLFLKTTFPFNADDDLTVAFSVPGHTEIAVSCKARVAWVNNSEQQCKAAYPPGIGVVFTDISPENLASISNSLDINKTE